jgi:hypothetical protein
MPNGLDIGINNGHGEMDLFVTLGMDDYTEIIEIIKASMSFPILNKNISDYYGEGEVYLNELNQLKGEVLRLQDCFKSLSPDSVFKFLTTFENLIETAIVERKTIIFLGD